jgi:proteasome lid subunit RPN8/RPN11
MVNCEEDTLMPDDELNEDAIKENLKQSIKEKLKKEILEEIYTELKSEEDDIKDKVAARLKEQETIIPVEHKIRQPIKAVPVTELKIEESVSISVKAILKIASHALKYAHSKKPREQWVEVIGLLAGKEYDFGPQLHIEDAYPMGHGTAIYAEIKDYNNYVRAFKDIKKKKLFICGWYHSHPSYGTWMSPEDISTQARYQRLWEKAIALVIDPYQIDGTSAGFEIFRANLRTRKWYRVPFDIEGALDIKMLPEILSFMNPIIEGKPAYLEYDEE